MAISYEAQLTLAYTDLATRNVNFTDVPSSAVSSMKAKIMTFNSDISGNTAAGTAYKETFISNDGAPVQKISKAKYTVTNEEVIYSGN